MNIEGKTAIVTGGASGLGAATAAMLASRGAKVAIFDLNQDAGETLAKDIGGVFHAVDVSSEASVAQAIAAVEGMNGAPQIVVNCAGIGPSIRILDRANNPHPLDMFRKTLEINLVGTFNVMSQAAASLARWETEGEEKGVFVNTASVAAFDGQIGQAAYAASKGGIVGLTLSAARDLAQHRIRVVTVAPGIFLTQMVMNLKQEVQDSLAAQIPHPRRLGKPAEYGQLVCSIIENPMINGEVIRLDGAIRMAPR